MGTSNDLIEVTTPLVAWERAACAVIGGVAAAAGTVAVFISENSVGTGALLAVGAFFLLIGTTGHPVERARLGDHEIQFARRLERSVTRSLENAPPDIKPRIAEAIVEASEDAATTLTQRARGIVFEQEVITAIHRVLADRLDEVAITPGGPDSEVDAFINRQDGVVVGLVLKPGRVGTDVLPHLRGDRLIPLLIISRTGIVGAAQRVADEHNRDAPKVALVRWRNSADDDALRSAIHAIWEDIGTR